MSSTIVQNPNLSATGSGHYRPMTKPTRKLDGIFKRNLRMLKRAFKLSSKIIADRSGVSERMVDYLLSGDRSPTVDVADQIGHVFGLSGWQMLYPNLTEDLARRGKLDNLLSAYGAASDEGKDLIEMVAQREAKYSA